MRQEVVIDVREQTHSADQEYSIIRGIQETEVDRRVFRRSYAMSFGRTCILEDDEKYNQPKVGKDMSDADQKNDNKRASWKMVC